MIVGAINPVPVVRAGDYSGVPTLSDATGSCSAVVLTGGRHILTAAHCADGDLDGAKDTGTYTLRFQKGKNRFDELKISSENIEIHEDWNGKVANGNDIALITLNTPLPSYITRYDIYATPDESVKAFNMVGWGEIGTGLKGVEPNEDLKLHRGQNFFDRTATQSKILVHDLDDPRVPGATNLVLEATLGAGDSGGPAFLNGRVAGIASYADTKYGLGMHGTHTRVSAFASWIDGRMGRSRDVIVNMNNIAGGNDRKPDTIEIERNAFDDRLLISVNGKVISNLEAARVDRIQFNGSSDNENIFVASDVNATVTIVGGGGFDKLNTTGGSQPLGLDSSVQHTITNSRIKLVTLEPRTTTDDRGDTIDNSLQRATSIKYSLVEEINVSASNPTFASFDVLSLPNFPVTIRTGQGSSNSVNVGKEGGSLDGLTKFLNGNQSDRLTIVGRGDDYVTINDQAASGRPTYSVDGRGVTRSRGFFEINKVPYFHDLSINLSNIDNVLVQGAKVGSNFDVMGTAAGSFVKLNGSDGKDNFTVGSSSAALMNTFKLNLDGAGGDDSLVVNDSAQYVSAVSSFPPVYEFSYADVVRSEAITVAGTVQVRSTEISRSSIEHTQLIGGPRNAIYIVREVPVGTSLAINGGNGSETFAIGSTDHKLDSIAGVLSLQGGGGFDLLKLDDAAAGYRGGRSDAAGAFNFYEVYSQGVSAAEIQFPLLDKFEAIELQTSVGRDKIAIPSTAPSATVTVNAGIGNDEITVGGTAAVDSVSGSLTVNGQDGNDKLILDDSKNLFDDRVITLTDTAVTYEFGLQVNHPMVESVDILGGKFADSVKVELINGRVPTTLSLGSGKDTLDYSSSQRGVFVDLKAGQATGLTKINDIENVIGGQANDVLLGNELDNLLEGRGGRDLLLGGLGSDTLLGGDNEDILLSGSADLLATQSARDAIMAEWIRTDLPYATRVDHVLQGGGSNGSTKLDRLAHVSDPAGGNTLMGDATALDLFFGSLSRDTHDRNGSLGEVFVDSDANITTIDASALTTASVSIDGISYDSTQPIAIQLQSGSHYLQIAGGGDTIFFTVGIDGKIGYEASLEGVLTGKGTSSLRVAGASVAIDARGLTSKDLNLDYMPQDGTKVLSTRLLPGSHFVYVVGGAPIFFTVTNAGTVDYAPELEGMLTGKGTSALQVGGASVEIDARALTSKDLNLDYLPQDGTKVLSTQLLPGSHFIHVVGGDPVFFTVGNDGKIGYDAAWEGFFSGQGTNSLKVNGLAVTIDATQMRSNSLSLDYIGYAGSAPLTLVLTPGQHFIQADGIVYWFTLSNAGLIDYAPELEGIFSGRGTSTLTFSD